MVVTLRLSGTWLEQAKQDGDLVYFGAEFAMDAFQEGRTYAGDARLVTEGLILPETRASTYVRGSAILVRPGNPLGIATFADLAGSGVNILVVHGAGQTALWEDMAALAGLVPEIRANITAIAADGADANLLFVAPGILLHLAGGVEVQSIVKLPPVSAVYRLVLQRGQHAEESGPFHVRVQAQFAWQVTHAPANSYPIFLAVEAKDGRVAGRGAKDIEQNALGGVRQPTRAVYQLLARRRPGRLNHASI